VSKIKAAGKTQIIALTPEERGVEKKRWLKVHQDSADRIGKGPDQGNLQGNGFDPAKL